MVLAMTLRATRFSQGCLQRRAPGLKAEPIFRGFASMSTTPDRPLSPHLTVWKWGPHMAVSILHRITGAGLATIGMALFVWWLWSAQAGPDSYATFLAWTTWPWFLIVWIGLTWAFFQHLLSGLRHFVMDTGAGFELGTNKFWANMTMVWGVLLTAALWAYIIYWRLA
jgi:succinate dehydrogenase / fumarate reductase cytochrome b subunit